MCKDYVSLTFIKSKIRYCSWLLILVLDLVELSGGVRKSERNYMVADGYISNFPGLTSFLNIWFNDFFSKDSAKSLGYGNPIDSFYSLGVALKNRSKVKKLSESIKNVTKAEKTRVWNQLRPKLFHQHLALNIGLLKKWC